MELLRQIVFNPFERVIYRPLGLNKNSGPAVWVAIFGLALSALILYVTDGNIMAAGMVLMPYILILITVYRIEYSLYILLFCVLFFDQFGIPGFDPFTFTTDYFRNLKEIRYLPYMAAGVVNPIELHILLLMGVWFFSLPLRKQLKFQAIPVWPAFILFLLTFTGSFIYGIKSGDFLVAMWEVRALFYLCFLYLFVPQVIHTKQQLRAVIWVSIIGITLKALQAIHRFAALGFTTEGFQTLTNHEDPVFTTTLFILLAGLFIFGAKGKDRFYLLLLLIPLMLGFYVGLRRAAYAGLMVSFGTLFFVLPFKYQLNFMKKSVPYVIMLFFYVIIFWNSNSSFAGPVAMIKSGLTEPSKEENYDDYYSNLYREFEDYNLAVTVRRKPIVGIGFGNKYDMPLNLANISFPLRDYIPHNEIFWYLVKTGAVGFFFFWLFFNSYTFKGVQILQTLEDPFLKAVCVMITLAVINQMVVSYFDLQLTYYRNMIYLGTLMGLMPAIKSIAEEDQRKKEEQLAQPAQKQTAEEGTD